MPRLLYILAAGAIYLMLWSTPITLFLAACCSCLTVSIYRKLNIKTKKWNSKYKKSNIKPNYLVNKIMHTVPLGGYVSTLFLAITIPVSTLILLVSPQAAAGFARFKELQANNFQLPPYWVERIQEIKDTIAQYPSISKPFDEILIKIDTLVGDAVSILVSRSFGFLGSTMNIIWTLILFIILTTLFSVYARDIRKITGRIFSLPQQLLCRFINAIYKALRAVMLGIILVALIQGFLCGIGFAVCGFNQPAFWGMLATLVAPIPFIGTALIWLPLSLSLWFTGKPMAAIGLIIWGAIVVAGIDNILRPFFLQQGIRAPFLVLVLAVLCGLASFGPSGLIVGPVLLAFAKQAVEEANNFYK